MKNFLYRSLFALLVLGFAACSDFGDIDNDPNKPIQVAPATLLTNAERTVASVVGSATGVLYAQQMSEITYTEGSRYVAIQADFSGWYTGAMQDLQQIIMLNTDEETKAAAEISGSNENQIAVATILQYYFIHHLTDRWGPLPWSEALRASEGLITPAYDSQEAIYNDIFSGLKAAVAMIDESGTIQGDFILNGDMAKWKQFANTIRLVAALRLSDVNPTLAESEFESALADGVLTETLYYPYLPETANQNPWYASFITRTDYALSIFMVDGLKAIDDPRLMNFADPALSPGLGIVGMPYGLASSDVNPENVSYPNSTYVKAQDTPIAIYTLAQIKFSLAEAAARGWTGGDAAALYKDAIQTSWDQWQVSYTPAEFDAYYMQPEVMYVQADWKSLIGYQKWIALYLQGYEAWAEYRRLDEPGLSVPEEPFSDSGGIPTRNTYPNDEVNLNKANYEEAVRMLNGPDSDGTKLWWDMN